MEKFINLAGIDFAGGGGSPTPPTPPGPTPSVQEKDVNLFDYDGRLLYSYTAAEFAALDVLPDNPAHEYLTADGWNWPLADAKAYVAKYGILDIGALYVSSDGKTRIFIELLEGRTSPYLTLNIEGEVSVDWGDGSSPESMTGNWITSAVQIQHNYEHAGKYIISIEKIRGNFTIRGTSYYPLLICIPLKTNFYAYFNAVKSIFFGDGITFIDEYAFYKMQGLQSLVIPKTIAEIKLYAFYQTSLRFLVLHNRITAVTSICRDMRTLAKVLLANVSFTIAGDFINECWMLEKMMYPQNFTTITGLNRAQNLTEVIIPDGITSIGNSFCAEAYSLAIVKCYAIEPPTLGSSCFSSASSDFVIYVPAASVDAYKAASGWSSYASRIQAIPE